MMVTPSTKSVLITGCSDGGIGSELAKEFHRRGLRVFATGRSLTKLKHLQAMGIEVLQLDVTDPQSIQQTFAATKRATGGRLDFLVNNAGMGYGMPLIESDLDTSRQIFEVNLFARAAVTQAFVPMLISPGGTVINIGSIAAVYPGVWQGMYSASCAAQHQWSDVLRIELEPLGVKVVLVITGAVTTNFLDNKSGCRLNSDSLYSSARGPIEALMNGSAVKGNFTPAQDFAQRVVHNALKPSPQLRFWAGGVSTSIWAVSTFLWATAWDWILAGQSGISQLQAASKVT